MVKLSVVIPSYNGAQKIARLLRSLEMQTFRDFETIVVIDGSTDGTVDYLRTEQFDLDVKIIAQHNQGRAAARNTGAKAASGNVVLFLDDDMDATPELTKRHLAYHQSHPDSALVGSSYRNSAEASTSFHRYLLQLEASWKIASPTQYSTLEHPILTAQQFSIPKEHFLRAGGFDERLSDAEDFDLCIRLLQSGTPSLYDSTIVAWHCDWPTLSQYAKRQREYMAANKRLLELHPEYGQLYPRLSAVPSTGLKSAFAKLFSRLFQHSFSTDSAPIRWLPEKFKFLCYRIIFSGSAYR